MVHHRGRATCLDRSALGRGDYRIAAKGSASSRAGRRALDLVQPFRRCAGRVPPLRRHPLHRPLSQPRHDGLRCDRGVRRALHARAGPADLGVRRARRRGVRLARRRQFSRPPFERAARDRLAAAAGFGSAAGRGRIGRDALAARPARPRPFRRGASLRAVRGEVPARHGGPQPRDDDLGALCGDGDRLDPDHPRLRRPRRLPASFRPMPGQASI